MFIPLFRKETALHRDQCFFISSTEHDAYSLAYLLVPNVTRTHAEIDIIFRRWLCCMPA